MIWKLTCKHFKKNIKETHERILKQKGELNEKNDERNKLIGKLESISSEEKSHVAYPWDSELDEPRSWWSFFNFNLGGLGWWSNRTFTFKNHDPNLPAPSILDYKVHLKKENEEHEKVEYNQDNNPERGIFTLTYKTIAPMRTGYIRIDIFVAIKDMPEHIKSAVILAEQIKSINQLINELNKTITAAESEKLNYEFELTKGIERSELLESLPRKITITNNNIIESEKTYSDNVNKLKVEAEKIIKDFNLYKSIKALISSLGYHFADDNTADSKIGSNLFRLFEDDFNKVESDLDKNNWANELLNQPQFNILSEKDLKSNSQPMWSSVKSNKSTESVVDNNNNNYNPDWDNSFYI